MDQTFEVFNLKCSGCASTLKTKLFKEFGEIEVNLNVFPRRITLSIEDKDISKLSKAVRTLGYPFASEEMSFMDSTFANEKSFVSCVIGKINA